MKSIREELGEDEGDVIEGSTEQKIAEAGMPETVEETGREGTAPLRASGRAIGRGAR